MDNRFLAIIPIIAILGFVSCQKTPDPVLSIGQSEYSISGDGGSFSVNVNTNVEVSIKISVGWIRQASVYPVKNTYSFTVACNDSYGSCDARTGNITFANSENGLLKTVTVHQEKGSILIAFKDQAAAAYSEYISTRSSIAIDNFEPGLPPIFVEDGVKEICVSKEGKVSFVR